MSEEKPIVFFDGRCPFCHRAVQALLYLDREKELRFAPLQGSTAQKYLDEETREALSTLVYRSPEGRTAVRSRAFLRALAQTSELYARSSRLLQFIPATVRNSLYRVIAENRYEWFGQYEQCRLPDPEDKRFLP